MPGLDAYYTPRTLAKKLVSFIKEDNIRSVIDFCVGDGGLLKVVTDKVPFVDVYGIDISESAIKKLSLDFPSWHLERCDFMNDKELSGLSILINKKFDLILLNPPFTCKGSASNKVELDGKIFKASTALTFVIKSLKYMSVQGGLYAILPISCLYSEKDQELWRYLKQSYNAYVLQEPERFNFTRRCSPNIALVYLGFKAYIHEEQRAANKPVHMPIIDVIRGYLSMPNVLYSSSKDSVPMIHTTNLRLGRLVELKKVIPCKGKIYKGYGVAIPRVCNPSVNKVVVLDSKNAYVLSDCIIVLSTKNLNDAIIVKDYILSNWHSFTSLYQGTGARYTTLKKLKKFFDIRT